MHAVASAGCAPTFAARAADGAVMSRAVGIVAHFAAADKRERRRGAGRRGTNWAADGDGRVVSERLELRPLQNLNFHGGQFPEECKRLQTSVD